MLLRLVCALFTLLATGAAVAERKWSGNYVLVLPKALRPTALSRISVQVESKDVALRIDSTDLRNRRSVTGPVSFLPTGRGVVNYRLPFANYRSKSVQLTFTAWSCRGDAKKCSQTGRRLFYENATFPILKDPLLIFAETSKPIYKPGERVRFRVLPLLTDSLQPAQVVSGKQKGLIFDIIYLEAPNKARVAQWRNVSWTDALRGTKLTFQLSADPMLGTWKIVARINGVEDAETFKVKKYVLPRFTVSVNPPSHIYIGDSTVRFSVCAKYTTGQFMKAKVKTEFCLRDEYENQRRPCLKAVKVLNGSHECAEFEETLRNMRFIHTYRNFKAFVNATVEEKGTNETVTKEEAGVDVVETPFKIVQLFANTFHPGLPFYGQVQTVFHNGSAKPNVKVECSCDSWIGRDRRYLEVLTSDANGIVNFGLPPFLSNRTHHVFLKFKAAAVSSLKSASGLSVVTMKRTISLTGRISRTHSPSNTFMQTYPLARLPPQEPCSAGKLSVLLQSNVALFDKTIHALSISRGNIQAATSFQPAADECEGEDGIAFGHYTFVRQKAGKYKLRCRPGWKGSNCNTATCEDGCFQLACPSHAKCACERGRNDPACGRCVFGCRGHHKSLCRNENDCWCYEKLPEYVSSLCHCNRKFGSPTDGRVFSRRVDIPITPQLYPASKIVLWFTHEASSEQQELVATTVTLSNLQDCLSKSTPTSFAFDRRTVRPGETVTASIRTSGSAPKCALAISDIALETFGARGGVSDSNLAVEIGKAVSQMQEDDACDEWRRAEFKDSSVTFKDAGVFVISNVPDRRKPCPYFILHPMQLYSASFMPRSRIEEMLKQEVKARVRSFFPENWKFEVLDDPKASLSLKAPDSMTTWQSTMYCVSSRGVGLSPPDKLVVFQSFFLQMALPYSLKRGEAAQIPVKVFSYRRECSEIFLTMEPSKQLETNGRQSVSACLCNFDQLTAHFRVRPNQLGKVPIKVEARSRASGRCPNPKGSRPVDEVADAVLRQLLVEAEGLPEEMSFGDLLCPAGQPVTTTLEITTPTKTGLAIAEGSERAYFMWSGNVIGSSLENLDSMVRMPYGCGEQNMITMVPSVYVLDYLTQTGAAKTQLMKKALDFIAIGYQRQLRYRLDDGSYSAFGKSDKVGSTWLTAFVFKSFVAANKYVEIDRQVLRQALHFLLTKTGARGCFREDGRVIHTKMQGGAKNETAISAYLLGALLEASEADPGLRNATAPAIAAAVRCLSAVAAQKLSNYGVALRAYALTKWNDTSNLTRRFQAELQRRRSSKDGFTFWRGTATEAALPFARPWSRYVTADVETTAYALLSLLADTQRGGSALVEVLPSLRWLTSQRNERGGWFSTQDSLLALQALSDFAKRSSGSGNGTELSVTVESKEGRRQVTLTNANKLLLSKMPISVPNSVKVTAKGRGCVVAQANVLFNVVDIGRAGAPFSLWATSRQRADRCDRADVLVCARYSGASAQSGMAIVKARMASGWQATKASIEALNDNVTEGGLKLIEVDPEKALVLYFDSFTATNSCVTFAVQRDIEVADVRPMVIQVYDYYKPHETQERNVQVVGKACEKPQSDAPTAVCPLCTAANGTAQRAIQRLCARPHLFASAELEKPGMMLYTHRVGDVIKTWNAALKLPKTCTCNITGAAIIAVHTRRGGFALDEDVALDGDWTVINVFSLSPEGHKNLRGSCAKKSEGFSFVYDMLMQQKRAEEEGAAEMKKKKKEEKGRREKYSNVDS